MERVPGADAQGNTLTKQVIGNKQDAAVTTVGVVASLMAYVKGIVNWLTVATADATTNAAAKDVIGNKTDAAVGVVGTTKSIVAYLKGLLGLLTPAVLTGETDIDDSVQTENTAWFDLLTIAPAAGAPLKNVHVLIDLAKATTGFAAVESTATIQLRIARKVDGTNWRGEAANEAALSGTNAASRCQRLAVGTIGVTEQVKIQAIMSADATADMELPYALMYEGTSAPTVTPVAAA